MAKGNPNGSAGRKGDKPWSEALRIAANEKDAEGKRKLRRIAEKTVEAAMAGDMAAIKEIGDRLDGKPTQGVDVGGSLAVKIDRADANL